MKVCMNEVYEAVTVCMCFYFSCLFVISLWFTPSALSLVYIN